ncbi:MAG: PQQ-binding-like beta-propeller repeat protein [Chloroflexaceae bacterium]|nr:PQQ-binding-like beta-propeller repeat protein [Chloroflexaceae bacterium]
MSLIKKGGTKGLGPGGKAKESSPETEASPPKDTTRSIGPPPATDGTALPQEQIPRRGDTTRNVALPRIQRPPESTPQRGDTTRGVRLPVDVPTGHDTNAAASEPDSTRSLDPNAPPPHEPIDLDPGDAVTTHGISQGSKRGIIQSQVLVNGTVLQGRYVIENVLGVGGMSVVYRGRDLRFKDVVRPCAIKEMYQSAPDSDTRMLNLTLFERESGMLATLQHTAIPKVFDFFEDHGRIYLVMELIPGRDLETVLDDEKGPISEERVARWAVQICDVLSYLHNTKPNPIIFRDMKPSNVLLTPEERIVLIDFGIARLVDQSNRKGTMIGTEGYSPPEQYKGTVESQSDIYALGATMHHLLTNSDPRQETPFTFGDRPIRRFNPAISAEMEAIVNKSLEYNMFDRWSSAEAMKQALFKLPVLGGVAMKTGSGSLPGPMHLDRSSSTTELVWKFTLEEEIRSSPCVSGDMVFIGCYDTNLYALDATRGDFRWKCATEGGVSSSPGVWQDMVIVGSEDGNVYGIEIRRGHVQWKFPTGKPVRSSARIHDRIVYIGSDNMHFYALDGLRGTEVWKYRAWKPFRSTAWVDNGSVYVGCDDGMVYGLDAVKGSLKWRQRTRQPIFSSPRVGHGLVFVGSMDNHLYALDEKGGFPVWRFRTNHFVNSSPRLDGSRVYVGSSDGNMYALEIKNGRLAWKFETGSQITSSPFVDGGRVYFGGTDNYVYCLDANEGNLIWKYPTQAAIVSSPVVVNGIVYIGSLDYTLYALKA